MEHGRPRDVSQLAIENELESHEKVVKNQNMQVRFGNWNHTFSNSRVLYNYYYYYLSAQIEYLQEKNYQLEKRLEELLQEKQEQQTMSNQRNTPEKVYIKNADFI